MHNPRNVNSMNEMDNSLNQAHQQSRKADLCLKGKKFEDALFAHRRAAEYLLQALNLTTCSSGKESIQLQHQYHLRQQDLIQRRIDIVELQKRKAVLKKDTGAQTSNEDFRYLALMNAGATKCTGDTDEKFVGIPIRRGSLDLPADDSVDGGGFKVRRYSLDKYCAESKGSVIKVPRDNSEIIEELTLQKEEMKKQIFQLVKDLEESKKANEYLVQKILNDGHRTRGERDRLFDSFRKDYDEDNDVKPNFELPPLEMPQFDFDAIQESRPLQDSILQE